MLDREQCMFLRELMKWNGIAAPRDMRIVADRKQDRARQKCKRAGFVTFNGGYWRMTDVGRTALREHKD